MPFNPFGFVLILFSGACLYHADFNNGNCAMGASAMFAVAAGCVGVLNVLMELCRLVEACQ